MSWHLPGRDPLRATIIGTALVGLTFALGVWQRATGVFTPLDHAIQGMLAAVQSRPVTLLMIGVTRFGSEGVLTAVAGLLYWSGRRRECALLLLLLLFAGTGANAHFKEWFGLLRPTAEVTAQLDGADGFGYPSGHTLTGVFLAWIVYHMLGRAWAWCALIVPLMALSRIYLGVHFPSDTLGGALHGVGWLFLAGAGVQVLGAVMPAHRMDDAAVRRGFLGGGLVACVLYIFMTPDPESAVRFGPLVAGAGAGAALMPHRWRPASPLRFAPMILVGMVLIVAVRVGLGRVLPDAALAHGVRYTLLGVALGASPRLMVALRLAQYDESRPAELAEA